MYQDRCFTLDKVSLKPQNWIKILIYTILLDSVHENRTVNPHCSR